MIRRVPGAGDQGFPYASLGRAFAPGSAASPVAPLLPMRRASEAMGLRLQSRIIRAWVESL